MKLTSMHRWGRAVSIALSAAAVIAVVLVAAGCGEEQAAADLKADTGGKMQITETFFDFGQVPVGQLVEHSFEIKNTGTGPLNLIATNVKRLEGC